MGTSDWVSIISLFSLLLSLAGFIWHVWSKFVFPKPCVAGRFIASNSICRPAWLLATDVQVGEYP